MVIKIDGIEKLKGHIFSNRILTNVTAENHFGSPVYVFHFPSIGNGVHLTWEHQFKIYLHRTPKNGSYEFFWMGLHGVTCQRLDVSEIRNFSIFYSYFEKIVRLGKTYWDESAKRK